MSNGCAITFQCNNIKSKCLFSRLLGDELLWLVDEFGRQEGFNTPNADATMKRFISWLNKKELVVTEDYGDLRTEEYSSELSLNDYGNNVIELDPTTGNVSSFIDMDNGKAWNHITDAEEMLEEWGGAKR